MEEKGVVPPRTPVEEELVERVAWQIQLRWFAALGVLVATWVASSILRIQLPPRPLYTLGLFILLYNFLFRLYLTRLSYPSPVKSSGYSYSALLRFYAERLEKESIAYAAIFDRFAKVQTGLDWLAMILLVHFSGGVESPLLFYFIFHLIIASILLSPLACYFFATLAAFAVGVLAILEYGGLIPHISLGFIPAPLYQNGLYIASVLFFFTTCLYIAVYLATSVTINLRQKDKELLRLQQRLLSAYQRLQTLYDVTKTVSSTLDLEKVLNLIARIAAGTMQVKACTIRLLDESGQIVDTVAAYGLSERYLTKGPIDVEKSRHIYQTLSSGQSAIISDTSWDDRLQYPAEAKAEGINSMLCVPLLIKGKAEGVICVYSTEPDHFSESDAEFLSALASEGAIAIENARTYKALEMADRAKSDFVQMVTHELRSPLSAVQSMLRVLEEGYVGPITSKQQDLIQRSKRRISFLLALVNDLLDLAAGKMEQLKGEKKEVVLNETISKVIELVQTSAEEKGLELEVEIAAEPLVLVGIEDGLERVFMNLVSNAVKYTPAGGSVAVRAWSEDNQIKVKVSDTGIGIPEEALPRIFDEFYRAKNAKAMEKEGTGLGLAIVKDVVEQHGGQISVESAVGQGSTFSVTLPKG
ncbi:MAG: ATP-binding protein [Anaerolineae bacterium]